MTDQAQEVVGSTCGADLIELSVVLVATANNPSIINHDFLVHNAIVDKDWQLQDNAIATPVFSQLVYQNGLTVRSDPERVMFVQAASTPLVESLCPKMAESYARAVPHVPYRAVGINPKLYVGTGDTNRAKVVNLLDDRGSLLSFQDSEPEIQLKAIYPFSSRKIIIDLLGASRRHSDGQQTSGLLFQANVHRDLEQTSSTTRIDTVVSILREWERDVHDCRKLADKFAEQAFRD